MDPRAAFAVPVEVLVAVGLLLGIGAAAIVLEFVVRRATGVVYEVVTPTGTIPTTKAKVDQVMAWAIVAHPGQRIVVRRREVDGRTTVIRETA